ncbi:hypothetical protein ACQJBY_046901 [Aegilops geniculata]
MHATDHSKPPTDGGPPRRSITAVRPSRAALPPSAGVAACLPPSLYPYPVACVRCSASGPARPYLYAAHATTTTHTHTPTPLSFPIPVPTDRQTRNSPARISLGELRRRSARPPPPPPLTRPPWRKPRSWRPGMGLSQLLQRFPVIRKRYKIGITSSCRKR